MPAYRGFSPDSSKIIMEAFSFVIGKIQEDMARKKLNVDISHHRLIEEEYGQETTLVENANSIIEKQAFRDGIFAMDMESHREFMSIIRSALEIYLRDVLEARAQTGLTGFDSRIQEIRRIINFEGVQMGRSDLFDKYYQASVPIAEGKRIEIFFSYATEDKVLAGKIARLLNDKGIDVFLAHEDIEISKEWRNEILKHLKNDDYLLALITENYKESVWANQEAGYMMGKGGKTISLIVNQTDIKNFGFLESFQGVPVEEENLQERVDAIIKIVLKE